MAWSTGGEDTSRRDGSPLIVSRRTIVRAGLAIGAAALVGCLAPATEAYASGGASSGGVPGATEGVATAAKESSGLEL